MTKLAKLADRINSILGGEPGHNLMRGMNPEALTKNEGAFGQEVDSFEEMVDVLKEDEGFSSKNRWYFQSDPNATDSPEIAASYAASGGEDYLLMVFDEDVEAYHMFGREYHMEEASWEEIDYLVATEENIDILDEKIEDVELVPTYVAPEEYIESVERPRGVTEKKSEHWYDLMYTLDKEIL